MYVFILILRADIKTSLKMSLEVILAVEFLLGGRTSDVCACVNFFRLSLVCVFVDTTSVALHIGSETEKRVAVRAAEAEVVLTVVMNSVRKRS
jgi:hypothetical protein